MPRDLSIRQPLLSWRRCSILGFLALLVYCLCKLGFDFIQLPPSADPKDAANQFFSAALDPATADQNPSLPEGTTPFVERIFEGILTTLRYAFIAMSIAVPAGLLLGFFASSAWWPLKRKHSRASFTYLLRVPLLAFQICTRFLITFMRSIHELIWVLLFLSFLGDSPITACIALALPFTGTLAKVFSEIIDEQNDTASKHILLSGGNNLQAFLVARLPQAFPDLITYTMYRLECAIRSSAVLGFIGIETIGLNIYQSYENTYYNEVWTELYLLILTVMLFDVLGSFVRSRVHRAPTSRRSATELSLKALKRVRPRWRSLPVIYTGLIAAVLVSWYGKDVKEATQRLPDSLVSCFAWIPDEPLNQYHSYLTRTERAEIFVEQIVPEPVREDDTWDEDATFSENITENAVWSKATPWLDNLWTTSGKEALGNTLVIATTALLLAALFGYTIVPWASRNISTNKPFGISRARSSLVSKTLWACFGFLMRFVFLVTRSIPEYILAFLLIGILGAHAWPLIFALAVHNFGILGRLWSEVSENHDERPARQFITRGGSRLQAYFTGILPTTFNRQLLFIFYRWETCVRESTILGMLSLSTLGFYIRQESDFLRYDSMMFYILLGTAVIFLSDIVSTALRAKLRSA